MYTVYRTINKINGKYYIGVHKTDTPADNYLGSGRALANAIKTYGRENFHKEILFIFEDRKSAYDKEKELTSNYTDRSNYNMKLGGVGGFTIEDAWKGFISKSKKGGKKAKDMGYAFGGENSNASLAGKRGGSNNKGKPKSEAHKQALRDAWAKKRNNLGVSNGETGRS